MYADAENYDYDDFNCVLLERKNAGLIFCAYFYIARRMFIVCDLLRCAQ